MILPRRLERRVVLGGDHTLRQHVRDVIIRQPQDILVDVIVVLAQGWRRPLDFAWRF